MKKPYLIKCCRSLSGHKKKAWRIDNPECYDLHNGKMYDIVWQANGEEDEIFIMVDIKDLEQLYNLVSKVLWKH